MTTTCRLWMVAVESDGEPSVPLDRLASAPDGVLHEPGARRGAEVLARWGTDVGRTPVELGSAAGAEALDALAARWPGGQVVLAVTDGSLAAATALALGVPLERAAHAFRGRGLVALDWPVPGRDGGRPGLAGMGLDWTPPVPSGPRQRFPGGPGSAPSARA